MPAFATVFPLGLPYNRLIDGRGGIAVEVVYIDSVFALNAILDYLLLLCTARLAGVPLKRLRYGLGGLLGGIYAAATFLPGCEFLGGPVVKAAAGVLMALTAYGCEPQFFRLSALLFGIACGLAGCVLAAGVLTGNRISSAGGILFADPNAGELLVVTTLGYLFFTTVFRSAARHRVRRDIMPVTVTVGGKSAAMTALADNGCGVMDPVTGQPVLIVSAKRLRPLLPEAVWPFLEKEYLRRPAELLEQLQRAAPELRFFLVPYRTVGLAGGLLLSLKADWVQVGEETFKRLPVGLAPGEVGAGYQALWGGTMGKEGAHDRFVRKNPAASEKLEHPAGRTHSLHRRQ